MKKQRISLTSILIGLIVIIVAVAITSCSSEINYSRNKGTTYYTSSPEEAKELEAAGYNVVLMSPDELDQLEQELADIMNRPLDDFTNDSDLDTTPGLDDGISDDINPPMNPQPPEASEYYDYLLCSGGGYMLVAKLEESLTETKEYIGVLDESYNWVMPLSNDTLLHNSSGEIIRTGRVDNTILRKDFKSRCNDIADLTKYIGNNVFVYGEYKNANQLKGAYYEASDYALMLNLDTHTWMEIGCYESLQSIEFTEGYYVARSPYTTYNRNGDTVKIISSTTGAKDTDIYCPSIFSVGRYSEGLFFAYDGFYDVNENLVIDLSEYAGYINNQPYFENGVCRLEGRNSEGTEYYAVIDKSGNFITEFTPIG